jgi:hypothetical protein
MGKSIPVPRGLRYRRFWLSSVNLYGRWISGGASEGGGLGGPDSFWGDEA